MLHSCRIDSDRNKFTETAILTLPNNLSGDSKKVTDYINQNDEIEINLGYAPDTKLIFKGYVSEIDPNNPTTIKCENEAWTWKQKSLKAFNGRNLKISTLLDGVGFDGALKLGADPIIGDWAVEKNTTVLNILEELRSKFGILSYWRKDGVLYIAEDFDKVGDSLNFSFQYNIINASLNVVNNAGDIQPISHGVSIQKDNTKIERYAYYDDGKAIVSSTQPSGILNTMSINNISESALDSLILRRLPLLRSNGITGSFTAFGEPMAVHGDSANVIDARIPEREGLYKIQRVETSFGVGGYRQIIELDRKLN